jgi:structural maintenance of chromosome 2
MNTQKRFIVFKSIFYKNILRLDNAKKENEKLEKELERDTQGFADKQKVFDDKQANVNRIKAELDALNFDSDQWEQLNLRKRELTKEIYQLNDRIQEFYSKFPQLNFEYKDPEPNFDRRRVKGLVANLFKIKDPKFSTALEVAAGGKVKRLLFCRDF